MAKKIIVKGKSTANRYFLLAFLEIILQEWHCFCIIFVVLRKILAISLLFLHLMGNTELCQIINIPNIFQHFQAHRQWNAGATFLDFISMHYMGNDGIDGDNSADHELPFMHFYHSTTQFATTPPSVCSSLTVLKKVALVNFTVSNDDSHQPPFVGSLLRPPRMAS